MENLKVLYVNQEVEPYVVGTQLSSLGLKLPQTALEKKMEVRTFMPRFGVINERRNQLHEVIRLSGLNLLIAGGDHPLIIKVASLQALRLQVYFIDNEDYFLRRGILHDELGIPYDDNDQRALFFAKGVLETVKKLRWVPDIIHCNGWFTSMLPMLVRTTYAHDPFYANVRILTSFYEDDLDEAAGQDVQATLNAMKIPPEVAEFVGEGTHYDLGRLAVEYSDAIARGDSSASEKLLQYAMRKNKRIFDLRTYDELEDVYSRIHR